MLNFLVNALRKIKAGILWVGQAIIIIVLSLYVLGLILSQLCIIYLPALSLWCLGLEIGFGVLKDFNQDTLHLSGPGFAILGAISSICFSWARAMESNRHGSSKRIIEIGEKTLISGILFLIASVIKYLISHGLEHRMATATFVFPQFLVDLLQLTVYILFIFAIHHGAVGLKRLSEMLWIRHSFIPKKIQIDFIAWPLYNFLKGAGKLDRFGLKDLDFDKEIRNR